MATPDATSKAATKSPAARFDFSKAAKKIVAEHPEIKGNTVFIDTSTGKRSGTLGARIKARLSGDFKKTLKIALEKTAKTTKAGSAHAIRDRGELNAVVMTTDRDFGLISGIEKDAQFAFHHEVAHIVVQAAYPHKDDNYFDKIFEKPYSRAEGAADAYATIRHLQQYGAGDIGRAPLKRAMDAIHHDWPEYLTTFVIDKILEDAKKLDFAAMTPVQVAEAASKYAERYTPTRAQSDQLTKEFAPLKGELYKASKENLAPFKKLAEIALNEKTSPLGFYLGNRIIGSFLGKLLNGPEWEEIAKKLHAKEQTMSLDTLLPEKPPVKKRKSHALPG